MGSTGLDEHFRLNEAKIHYTLYELCVLQISGHEGTYICEDNLPSKVTPENCRIYVFGINREDILFESRVSVAMTDVRRWGLLSVVLLLRLKGFDSWISFFHCRPLYTAFHCSPVCCISFSTSSTSILSTEFLSSLCFSSTDFCILGIFDHFRILSSH